ncbi:MAG: regulatory protein RecX [bacterium]
MKDHAFNLLSYRDRSTHELQERLLKKGYQEEDILKVIERLKELSYIDDRSFAEKWVRDRIKHKPRGKNMLKKELFAKGIDNKIVNQVLNDILDMNLEIKMGSSLAEKWLSTHPPESNKLKRYLYYKGFSAEVIYAILEQVEIPDVNIKKY